MATAPSQISGIIKTVYRKPLLNAMAKRNLLWKKFTANNAPITSWSIASNNLTWAVELVGATGPGHRSVNEYVPDDVPFTAAQATTSLYRFYATLAVDGLVQHLADGNNERAFAEYIGMQMKSIVRHADFQLNRMLHGDGTGVLATVNGAVNNSTTVTLTHPYDYTYGATQFIEDENAKIVFLTSGGAYVTDATVSAIDWDNQRITTSAAVTVPDNALVVYGDDQGYDYNKQPLGFRGFIQGSGTTVYGISTTTYRRWRSNIVTTSAGPYEWKHFLKNAKAVLRYGDDDPILTLIHPAVSERHSELYENDVRYTSRQFSWEKGMDLPVISIDGQKIQVMEDKYLGFGEMVTLCEKDIFINEVRPFGVDSEGSGAWKQVTGKDAKYQLMKMYYGVGALRLNRFARTDGIQVDQDYVSLLHEDL